MIYVLVFLGLITHYVFKVNKAKKYVDNYGIVSWLKDNKWHVTLSILSAVALVIMVKLPLGEEEELFGFTFYEGYVKAFAIGWFNSSLIRNIVGSKKKKKSND